MFGFNKLESKENDVNILMYGCLSPLAIVMSKYFSGKRAADEQTRRNLANMIALLSLMQPDHYKKYVDQFNWNGMIERVIKVGGNKSWRTKGLGSGFSWHFQFFCCRHIAISLLTLMLRICVEATFFVTLGFNRHQ